MTYNTDDTRDYLLKMMRSMRDRMELLREWQDTGTVPEDLADDYGHGADLYEVMADYPLAFHIAGVAALDNEDDEDELEPGVVWIAAGDHPDRPYAPHAAFSQAQY